MRERTIAVSDEEKQLLDQAAADIFGTTDVPYGGVISALATQQIEEDVN